MVFCGMIWIEVNAKGGKYWNSQFLTSNLLYFFPFKFRNVSWELGRLFPSVPGLRNIINFKHFEPSRCPDWPFIFMKSHACQCHESITPTQELKTM